MLFLQRGHLWLAGVKGIQDMVYVVIIYHRFQTEISEIITGLLRLCGIYVLEYVFEQVTEWNSDECAERISKDDIVLALNLKEEKKNLSHLSKRIIYVDYENGMTRINFLLTVISGMKMMDPYLANLMADGIMNFIVNQYLFNGLMYENFQIRLLFDEKRKDEISERMSRNFETAAENVEKLLGSNKYKYRLAFYFINECKRKANIACRIGSENKKKSRIYETSDMLNEIWKMLEIHPEYAELYSLCAMISDEDINYTDRAEKYYKKALESDNTGDIRIQGYNHYRLGRYYEKILKDNKVAFEEYSKAYESDPTNYRFTYKVGYYHELNGNCKSADMYYRKIVWELMPNYKYNYLQPSQCEYLFKVFFRLMLMYKEKMGQLRLAKLMGESAIELNNRISENLFFDRFYSKKDVNNLKSAMKERLQTYAIEEHMSDIDRQLQRFL